MAVNIYGKLMEVCGVADFLAGRGSVEGLEELHSRTPWNTYRLELPKLTEEVKSYVNDKLNSAKEGDKATERVKVGDHGPDASLSAGNREESKPVHRSSRTGRVSKRQKPEGKGEDTPEVS